MNLDRRGFLKLASLLPLVASRWPLFDPSAGHFNAGSDRPNVIILVFDALSALHVSLYGYQRETMPNLTRIAERATVFHSHYSSGNYTTPGTASILTGVYPWTHRALSHQATTIDSFQERNIFSEFGKANYTRMGFSHNYLVDVLLYHFRENLDAFTLPNEISLVDYNFSDDLFFRDYVVASRVERVQYKKPGEVSNSLFLAPLLWAAKTMNKRHVEEELRSLFPRGVPGYHDMLYPLDETVDWMMQLFTASPQPFIAYMHMMPPHDPYNPSREFVDRFFDEWEPEAKPPHFYSEGHSQATLNIQRRRYDQYVAYVDAELGRFYDFLKENGFLENTWLVFTSDHGEMFERGIWKHTTRTLFQPIIRVPLLICEPGQLSRQNVSTFTSNVDLLPTLLKLAGQEVPAWCEGEILPPYNEEEPKGDRSLFVVEAKSNPKFGPFIKGTAAMIKGQHKIIYYKGYEGFDGVFEAFDLKEDPGELNNIYAANRTIVSDLENELLEKSGEIDRPYVER
jgi:arylsulfatase